MPTAKTTLNPAYGELRICLQKRRRLDDPISFSHVGFDDPSISYHGEFRLSDEYAKSVQDGARITINPPKGAKQILPILQRYEWAGAAKLRSGGLSRDEDLYSWYPYVMPTQPIPVANSQVEIEMAGRNEVARWTEIMFYGYMWR